MKILTVISFFYGFFATSPCIATPRSGDEGISRSNQNPSIQPVDKIQTAFNAARFIANNQGCKPADIVLAIDLENTLLAPKDDLGSEQWFDWQAGLLRSRKAGNEEPELLAGNLQELYSQYMSMTVRMKMHPTERHLGSGIQALQKEGFKIIVITSRSPDLLEPTLKQLIDNGIDPSLSTIHNVNTRPHLPYDPEDLSEAGFNEEERHHLYFDRFPREIRLRFGVFFTWEQHRGVLLRALFHEAEFTPCALLYVDNKESFGFQVHEAFRSLLTSDHLRTFRYTKSDTRMSRFMEQPKESVIRKEIEFLKKSRGP